MGDLRLSPKRPHIHKLLAISTPILMLTETLSSSLFIDRRTQDIIWILTTAQENQTLGVLASNKHYRTIPSTSIYEDTEDSYRL